MLASREYVAAAAVKLTLSQMNFIPGMTSKAVFSTYVSRSGPTGAVDVKNTEVLVLRVRLPGRGGFTRREGRSVIMKFQEIVVLQNPKP